MSVRFHMIRFFSERKINDGYERKIQWNTSI
jgi:hypothetical protein